jgi:hypothetical protein
VASVAAGNFAASAEPDGAERATHARWRWQGVAVGNGCIGTDIGTCSDDGNRSFLEQLAALGFYSPEIAAVMPTVCENYATPTPACLALQDRAFTEVGDDYNIYNLFDEVGYARARAGAVLFLQAAYGICVVLTGRMMVSTVWDYLMSLPLILACVVFLF